jgi:hypothetical protein
MNKFLKMSLVFCVFGLFLTGCAYNSSYRNYTDSYGNNRVEATGEAAVAAGSAHGSYNCINCVGASSRTNPSNRNTRSSRQMINPVDEVYSTALRSGTSALSQEVSRSITEAIRGW